MSQITSPILIELKESFVDDRGTFANIPFDMFPNNFKPVRTYFCENFQKGTVRGFHYHAIEEKVFICLRGAIKFVIAPVTTPTKEAMDDRYMIDQKNKFITVLSAKVPKLLYVPSDYANGWQTLTDDALLLGMSSLSVTDSVNDDIRISPYTLKELWEIKWR